MSKLDEKDWGCYWCRFRKKLSCSKFKKGGTKNTPLSVLSINVLRVEELKNNRCGHRCWGFKREENKKERVDFT